MLIPVCEPVIGQRELEFVTDCVKTNWISSQGKYVAEFEKKFAEYCGCKYGISATSGTTALHLAIACLNIKQKDEVIVPAFTMAAPVFAVVYSGAKPVLIDSEPETGNMDVAKIEEKITARTKGIVVVHIYGHPCDMDPILGLAEKYNLTVIEDAAEAHGAEYKGKKVGGIGHIGCFSFYANKIITTGEGGMVVTNDEGIAERVRSFKDMAHIKGKRFLHSDVGFNYRMTNVQAAIGLAQFENIDAFVGMRRNNAHIYSELLGDIKGLSLPVEMGWAKGVYWMYTLLVNAEFGMSRDEVMESLCQKGIETRQDFIPMHLQPAFQKLGLFQGERYPVSEELSQKGFYLPSGSGLRREQIEYVCQTIREICRS